MTKTNIIFFIFILSFFISVGQDRKASRITLRATTSVSGGEYFLNIVVKDDSLKVIYKLKDSVSGKFEDDVEVKKSKRLLQEVKNFKPDNDTVFRAITEIDRLHQAYTSYSIDSITLALKETPSYEKLFRNILTSSTETLENKMTNKDRLVWMEQECSLP